MSLSKKTFLFCAILMWAGSALWADDCKKENSCNGKVTPPSTPVTPPAGSSTDWRGDYSIKAAGYYSGSDTVKVNAADKLHLQITLKDAAGNSYGLNIPNLDITDGHFRGSGSVNGVQINVDGRFDAPAAGTPWRVRFICNYRDANGHAGRIIGIKQS